MRKASAGLLFPRYVPVPGGDTVVGIRVIQLSNVRKKIESCFFNFKFHVLSNLFSKFLSKGDFKAIEYRHRSS